MWGVDYEWIKKQFASQAMMEKPGITVSRWIDAVLEKNENLDQDPNLRAVVFWGHAPNSQNRGKEMVEAMKKLDLLVVIDPYPSATAAMAAMVRQDGVYLLPAATQMECAGSVDRVEPLDPVAREGDRPDVRVAHRPHDHVPARREVRLRQGVRRRRSSSSRARAAWTSPTWKTRCARSTAATWTIGYTGQSPERLQAHMRNLHVFDVKTLRAKGGKDAKTGYVLDGDYYGLPWPCYGNAGAEASRARPISTTPRST